MDCRLSCRLTGPEAWRRNGPCRGGSPRHCAPERWVRACPAVIRGGPDPDAPGDRPVQAGRARRLLEVPVRPVRRPERDAATSAVPPRLTGPKRPEMLPAGVAGMTGRAIRERPCWSAGRSGRACSRRLNRTIDVRIGRCGFALRMGGRAVEGTGLENQQALMRLVGSNPTPSAIADPFFVRNW